MDLQELEKLAKLKDKGIITEEQFNQKKQEILGVKPNNRTRIKTPLSSKATKILLGSLATIFLIGGVCTFSAISNDDNSSNAVNIANSSNKVQYSADDIIDEVELAGTDIITLFASQRDYNTLNNELLITMGIYPSTLNISSKGEILNRAGKNVKYTGYGNYFEIQYKGISTEICNELLQKSNLRNFDSVEIDNADSCEECGNDGCDIVWESVNK